MFQMKPRFFLIITLLMVFSVNAKYRWRDNIPRGDSISSIVALELRNETIGTGVFITQGSILTSANILEYLAANGSSYTHIYVHHMWGQPKSYHWVWCVRTIHKWNRYRSSTDYWVRQGFDRKNSPVHDLYVLGLFGNTEDTMFLLEPMIAITRGTPFYHDFNWIYANCDSIAMIAKFLKEPRPVVGITPDTAIEPSAVLNPKYMFYAGFACCNNGTFEDKDKTLIIVEDIHLVDCDEWVPREWGYFICLQIEDETRVPSAGTPLFYNFILVGLASFTMTRNDETIHVFTDIRPYYEHLWVCKPFHMNLLVYKKWRYVTFFSTYMMPMIIRHMYFETEGTTRNITKALWKVAIDIFNASLYSNIAKHWSFSFG